MPSITIVIPALNEGKRILHTLDAIEPASELEVIVADAGSTDDTPRLAASWGARVILAPRCKARQMNAGAAVARGEVLLFLHADTLLPRGFRREIIRTMARPGVSAGAFRLRFDGKRSLFLRIIECTANWRAHYLQMPFGDQGIFLRKTVFREVGGFPRIPIMEDVEIVRRLRRRGCIMVVPLCVVSSARRYERDGAIRRTLINKAVFFGYLFGVSPNRLLGLYETGEMRR